MADAVDLSQASSEDLARELSERPVPGSIAQFCTDDDLLDAMRERGLSMPNLEDADVEIHEDDIMRLAEAVAEGRNDDALDVLADLAPGVVNPTTARYLAAIRASQNPPRLL